MKRAAPKSPLPHGDAADVADEHRAVSIEAQGGGPVVVRREDADDATIEVGEAHAVGAEGGVADEVGGEAGDEEVVVAAGVAADAVAGDVDQAAVHGDGAPVGALEGVGQVVDDDVDAKLQWLLARMLDKSPAAIRRGLYTLKGVESMAFEQAMSFTESQIALFTLTEDAKEGQKAFQEKRKPNWAGQ